METDEYKAAIRRAVSGTGAAAELLAGRERPPRQVWRTSTINSAGATGRYSLSTCFNVDMDQRYRPDGRSNRKRMLAGDEYVADDPELQRESDHAAKMTATYNATAVDDHDLRERILRRLLGSLGEGTVVRPPFRCDYGYQTHIGSRTFANWGLICLDVGRITIGDDVQIGPNVQLLTATHPIEPEPRQAKWEGSKPIEIADNVWLGGGVIVCPGVSIGTNTVVGAGAVVAGDLPANVFAVGNPARILRSVDGELGASRD